MEEVNNFIDNALEILKEYNVNKLSYNDYETNIEITAYKVKNIIRIDIKGILE